MVKRSFDEIKIEVKKLVTEIAEVPEKDLTDDARFTEDLGVDSMKALEIVACLEKKLKITITEEEIPKIRSLGDVYKIVEKKVKK
ncbi:MAG: acyl carrier protein [Candidatus Omnitrophota bacterium]|jgi:acyl carrier protein